MQHAIGILAVLFFSFHFNVFKLLISQLIRLNCFFYFSGPFKVNGVPIRRVDQTYVIATSTKVDISGVDVSKFDDKYFARDKKKVKKTEGELFETEKEVGSILMSFSIIYAPILTLHLIFRLQSLCLTSRRMTRRLWMLL
jgi:hypothetical protein